MNKTVAKLRTLLAKPVQPSYATPPLKRLPCLRGTRIKLMPVSEVELVRSDAAGVHLVTAEGEFFTELTLKVLADRGGLVRCHKQYLVNLDRIDEVALFENGQGEIRAVSGQTVPVSRRYLTVLKERLDL